MPEPRETFVLRAEHLKLAQRVFITTELNGFEGMRGWPTVPSTFKVTMPQKDEARAAALGDVPATSTWADIFAASDHADREIASLAADMDKALAIILQHAGSAVEPGKYELVDDLHWRLLDR